VALAAQSSGPQCIGHLWQKHAPPSRGLDGMAARALIHLLHMPEIQGRSTTSATTATFTKGGMM